MGLGGGWNQLPKKSRPTEMSSFILLYPHRGWTGVIPPISLLGIKWNFEICIEMSYLHLLTHGGEDGSMVLLFLKLAPPIPMGVKVAEHDFSVQIWTFYSILNKNYFKTLPAPYRGGGWNMTFLCSSRNFISCLKIKLGGIDSTPLKEVGACRHDFSVLIFTYLAKQFF